MQRLACRRAWRAARGLSTARRQGTLRKAPSRLEQELLPPREQDQTAQQALQEATETLLKQNETVDLPGVCFICGGAGHWARTCPSNNGTYQSARARRVCYLCGQGGHEKNACPDRKRAAFPMAGVAATRIFVENLASRTNWASLKDHFRQLGFEAKYSAVSTDMFTGKSQLRGIVEFDRPKVAAAALARAHESELDGVVIACRFDDRMLKQQLLDKKAPSRRDVRFSEDADPADGLAPAHQSRRSRNHDYDDRFEDSRVLVEGAAVGSARPWRYATGQKPATEGNNRRTGGQYDADDDTRDYDDDFNYETDDTTGEVKYPDNNRPRRSSTKKKVHQYRDLPKKGYKPKNPPHVPTTANPAGRSRRSD